jgi:hypothetical protein
MPFSPPGSAAIETSWTNEAYTIWVCPNEHQPLRTVEAWTRWSVFLVDLISRLEFSSPFPTFTMGFNLGSWSAGVVLTLNLSQALPDSPRSPITAWGLLSACVAKLWGPSGSCVPNVWAILILYGSHRLWKGRSGPRSPSFARWFPDWCQVPS